MNEAVDYVQSFCRWYQGFQLLQMHNWLHEALGLQKLESKQESREVLAIQLHEYWILYTISKSWKPLATNTQDIRVKI